jgi:hypothetical protein
VETRTVKILRIVSLLAITASLWYFLIAPSLKLKDSVEEGFKRNWADMNEEQKGYAREVAKLDLETKVYPEIQDRLSKINDWFINKMLFAGGLLGAFLLQLWWPFWSQNTSVQDRERQSAVIFFDLLSSAPVCAVLGLACVVSLFMDIHIRRSLLVVHQLGTWAGKYAIVALGGSLQRFPGWEQFLRMGQDSPGMHESLIDAIQTGNLSLMTLVLFAFYHSAFQQVCRQGLGEFNRLTYWLLIVILLGFLLVTHGASGNFEFVPYKRVPFLANFWGYFAAWSGITLIMVAWDFIGGRAARHARYAAYDGVPETAHH